MMVEAEYSNMESNILKEKLHVKGESLFCRFLQQSEKLCEETSRDTRTTRTWIDSFEIFYSAKILEVRYLMGNEEIHREERVKYIAVLSSYAQPEIVCDTEYLYDSSYDYIIADTMKELEEKTARTWGIVRFGEIEPFEIYHIEERALKEALNERFEYVSKAYMEEWIHRLETGKWLYDADDETAKALLNHGVIPKWAYDARENIWMWREAKGCD